MNNNQIRVGEEVETGRKDSQKTASWEHFSLVFFFCTHLIADHCIIVDQSVIQPAGIEYQVGNKNGQSCIHLSSLFTVVHQSMNEFFKEFQRISNHFKSKQTLLERDRSLGQWQRDQSKYS